MGNGVNVGAVWHILREHIRRDEDILKRTVRHLMLMEYSAVALQHMCTTGYFRPYTITDVVGFFAFLGRAAWWFGVGFS